MTQKQQAFVEHYVICRNGAEAARLAGYSEKTARQIAAENLSKPYIQAALAEKEDELKVQMDLDKAAVINELLGAIEVAKTKLDGGNIIRGWVEIAKMLGLYAPEKIEVTASAGSDALRAKYAAMSDDELYAIMEGKTAAGA